METSALEIAAAIDRAGKSAAWWSGLPVRQRSRILREYRDQLLDHLPEIIRTVAAETNKPRFDIVGELFHACDVIGYFAKQSPRLLRPRRIRPHLFVNKQAVIHQRPYGVVGIITPWNYPLVLVLSPVTQALMAGNTVLLKPSEHVTKTALLLERILAKLQLPHLIMQVLPGGPETALALARSPVDKLAFTGGYIAGQAVAEAAAKSLTPILLELGGNDAMLIAADADIERAARAAVWGSFFNAGQSCIAVERCFVEAPVADAFLNRVVDLTRTLTQGNATLDPNRPDFDLGPLLLESSVARVQAMIDDAVARGATIRHGGIPNPAAPTMFPPTVLGDVMPSMRVMQEEIFGPLLAVMRVASLEAAVTLANRTPMGLSASIWTRNNRRAQRLAADLEVGGVMVNDCMTHFGIVELPFGGVKRSGFGRTQGREGLLEFCTTQTITTHRFGPRREFQWFPAGKKYRWLQWALRVMFRSGLRQKLRQPQDSPGSADEPISP